MYFDECLDKPVNIKREGAPSKYDQFPYLSTCFSIQENKTYVQCSKDENNPDWQIKE